MTQKGHQFPCHMTSPKDEYSAIIIVLLGVVLNAIQLIITLMLFKGEDVLHWGGGGGGGGGGGAGITTLELIQDVFCENFCFLASRQIAIL